MISQSPSKETLSFSGAALLKNLFIKSYIKCNPAPFRRIISEKVECQTELEIVSQLFCVEDIAKATMKKKQAV